VSYLKVCLATYGTEIKEVPELASHTPSFGDLWSVLVDECNLGVLQLTRRLVTKSRKCTNDVFQTWSQSRHVLFGSDCTDTLGDVEFPAYILMPSNFLPFVTMSKRLNR